MTTASDLDNYPRPRGKRSVGAAIEEAAHFAAPRMRVFPWSMLVGPTSRYGYSMPMIRGPALVKDINWTSDIATDPVTCTLEIGRSSVPVEETNLALGTVRAWECLTELQDPFGIIDPRAGNGFPITTGFTWATRPVVPLDLVLGPGEHYVVIAATNFSANTFQFKGHLRVLEAINPEALSFFL